MKTHILQTKQWADFKSSYGTEAIKAGKLFYTKHSIPFTNMFYAYCPRVNPADIDFDVLRASLEEHNCIACHLDVPNIIKGSAEEASATSLLEEHCKKSPRDEFAKGNFILDLTPSLDTLLANMHPKQRYNIKLAEKKGAVLRKESSNSLDIFYDLYVDTAKRQGYFYRSKSYFEKIIKAFDKDMVHILIIEFEGEPLAAWMLFVYDNVLYYPYGGSSTKNRNIQPNALIGWEAIQFGKKHDCEYFDMWGAAYDMNDAKDPYYGFTDFKRKFGGQHVQYINSYDFVVNNAAYNLFNTANSLRWKLLNLLR
jgi:lipid II:glycine glycyltransferase (peptidoglycan interpeptide bridge formation enzyme)